MEELIRQGLPGVDEGVTENVIKHLKELGMTYAEDCQYIEESYLSELLKPIQIKKLMACFKNFCSDSVGQSQIVCNVEFEEQDHCLISKSPVPYLLLSDSSTTPTCSISSSISSLNQLKNQPAKNWAENFSIPWDSFSREVLEVCESQKRLRKCIYSEMVRILSEHISRIDPSPGRSNLRIIAKKIIARYPATFQDRCGDSIIDGCSTLMKKIEYCLENRRRRKDFCDLFEVKADGTNLKKTVRNSYACSNWQPNQLPDGESKASQMQNKNWLISEHRKLNRDEAQIKECMFKTYASQRYTINSKISVKVIKEEWPVLFENKHFINHAEILLGKKSLCDTIINNIDIKGKIVYNFMKTLEKKTRVSNFLRSIEDAKEQLNSSNSEVLGAILLISAFFSEDEEELFQINMDPVSTTDLEANPGRLTPFIATSGGNIFSAEEFLLIIDGTVALQTTEFKLAVALLIMSYFVFNIEYPERAALTLDFVQRIFADINPQRGSKMPKNRKRNTIPKPVLNLVNSLRDFETHFNL